MEVVVDGKTVSLKHYLNRSLQPWDEDENGVKSYPLYTQIVYNTLNTKFKTTAYLPAGEAETIFFREDQEDKVLDGSFLKDNKWIKEADEKILGIIEYEIKTYGNKFTLKGLGKRIAIYATPIKNFLLDDPLGEGRRELLNNLGNLIVYNDFEEIRKASLYGIMKIMEIVVKKYPHLISKLPPKYTFLYALAVTFVKMEKGKKVITCFDWLTKDYPEKFYQEILSFYENSKYEEKDIDNQIETLKKALTDTVMEELGISHTRIK